MIELLIKLEAPEERLLRILKENIGRYKIDEDGIISTNWEHPAVQAEMRRQLDALNGFKLDNQQEKPLRGLKQNVKINKR